MTIFAKAMAAQSQADEVWGQTVRDLAVIILDTLRSHGVEVEDDEKLANSIATMIVYQETDCAYEVAPHP